LRTSKSNTPTSQTQQQLQSGKNIVQSDVTCGTKLEQYCSSCRWKYSNAFVGPSNPFFAFYRPRVLWGPSQTSQSVPKCCTSHL